MSETNSPILHTYGCKVNTYDASLLQDRLAKIQSESEIHVLNTCAVTAEATKEALTKIKQIKKKNPQAKVVVTGCSAQVDVERLKESAADLIVANSHKGQLEHLLEDYLKGKTVEKIHHSNIFRKEDLEYGGGLEDSHTRAFLKIQDGCNSFCTYCVIPFARGKSRSIPIPKLLDKMNEFYDKGIREVVITGVHIGDYISERVVPFSHLNVKNQPEAFDYLEELMESALAKTKIPRFRISSLEPVEVSDRLLGLYQDPRMCPHFHMSIQSANTRILAGMKRKYSAQDIEKSLNKISLKIPNVFVGMDVIVGFPGETEEEFLDTYHRLNNLDWTRIHVFPYSDRPGTRAIEMTDKVESKEIHSRAALLRALSLKRFNEKAKAQVGKIKKCLLLQKGERLQAISRDYWTVELKNKLQPTDIKTNEEVSVVIDSFEEKTGSRMQGLHCGRILE